MTGPHHLARSRRHGRRRNQLPAGRRTPAALRFLRLLAWVVGAAGRRKSDHLLLDARLWRHGSVLAARGLRRHQRNQNLGQLLALESAVQFSVPRTEGRSKPPLSNRECAREHGWGTLTPSVFSWGGILLPPTFGADARAILMPSLFQRTSLTLSRARPGGGRQIDAYMVWRTERERRDLEAVGR